MIVDEVIGCYVWLQTDFPTKRVQPIPYTKCVNYSTDSLLVARGPKNPIVAPHCPNSKIHPALATTNTKTNIHTVDGISR